MIFPEKEEGGLGILYDKGGMGVDQFFLLPTKSGEFVSLSFQVIMRA